MTSPDAPIARLSAVVLDCPDPAALAGFYAALLGGTVTDPTDEEWVSVVLPGAGVGLDFQRVEQYVAPAWPGTEPPQQFHLDVTVDDLDAAEAATLALGATKHDVQPGTTFRVFLDPVGHPFCLCQA